MLKQSEKQRANKQAVGSLALILIVLIVVGSVVATAIIWQTLLAPSHLVTEDQDFKDFTIVSVGHAFEVKITQSSTYSINITADEYVSVSETGKDEYTRELTFDHIKVTKTDDTLTIGLKPGYTYQPTHLTRPLVLRAEIEMPELHELSLSGATHGTVESFTSSHELVLIVSGASYLDLDTSAGDIEIHLSGASHLNGEGSASNLVAEASGASHLDLSALPVQDAYIFLSGASWAIISLDGQLDADLTGASHIRYIGEPTMGAIQTSGDSTVEKRARVLSPTKSDPMYPIRPSRAFP